MRRACYGGVDLVVQVYSPSGFGRSVFEGAMLGCPSILQSLSHTGDGRRPSCRFRPGRRFLSLSTYLTPILAHVA